MMKALFKIFGLRNLRLYLDAMLVLLFSPARPRTHEYLLIMMVLTMIDVSFVSAQEINSIKAIARPKPDSILLRWAPSNKETWKLGNQYGYMLERVTMVENKVRLAKPKRELLTSTPIKPHPLPAWEPVAKNSKYGAIAAQALYGEDFKVDHTAGASSTGAQLYQKATEQDMRFGFALFAADLDVATATASALRFVDRKVRKGDKYLYKVYINHPVAAKTTPSVPNGTDLPPKEGDFLIDTALVFTGVDEYAPLPKPAEFSTVFLDSVAVLSWNTKVQQDVYLAYDIERSRDGGVSFQARNSEPFVPILKDHKNPFAFYKDSTLANTELQYRIRGLNAFGEKGPYSIITKGKSQTSSQQAPKELKYAVDELGKVRLSWSYHSNQLPLIKGFKVYRSAVYEKGYTVVSGAAILPKTQLDFVDNNPLDVGYYQVVAVDAQNRAYASFPLMVQFEDLEPPKAPTGLKGSIDKQGKVTLAWAANTEKDLLGYYVYVSNGRRDEFSRLTADPLKINALMHKISLETLTDSIYYEVLALDKRFNQSPRSLLALPRPDILPPAPIALIETKGTERGIQITWHNSASKDAHQYWVYKFEGALGEDWKNDPQTQVYAKISHQGDTTVFLDTNVQVGRIYQYGIDVIDKSGIRAYNKIYTLKTQRTKMAFETKVIAFKGAWHENKKKIELSWKATGAPVKHWIVYRSSQGERLAQYESAKGESFTDIKVEPMKTYNYILRPVYMDRTLGELSETLSVKSLE